MSDPTPEAQPPFPPLKLGGWKVSFAPDRVTYQRGKEVYHTDCPTHAGLKVMHGRLSSSNTDNALNYLELQLAAAAKRVAAPKIVR